MKNEKGITLVSLIITIVLMLILLGVTVAVSIDGGIFEKTRQAKRETEKATWDAKINEEILTMNKKLEASDKYEFEFSDEALYQAFSILLTDIQEKFELDNKYVIKVSDEDYSILNYEQLFMEGYIDDTFNPIRVPCKYNGREIVLKYEVDMNEETGTVKIAEVSIEVSKISIVAKNEPVKVEVGENIASVTQDGVPIPKGFYYVTGTKNTGVVISDNQLDENKPEGNSGNQYVWVPVNINPKLEIEIDSENIIEEVKIENTGGYNETINVNSNYYKKVIDLTGNSIYLVTVKYEDGTIEEYIKEVNKAYSKFDAACTSAEVLLSMSGMSLDAYMEQTIQDALKENLEITKMDIIRTLSEGFNEETVDNASETPNVLKYGGFYIGRYEASLTYGIRKSVNPTSGISYEEAKVAVETLYKDTQTYGVTADLPSAAAWDAVGGWLIDTNNKNSRNIYYSSENWGNYRVKSSNTTSKKNTGSSESYKANNIYDMAGNLEEWTKATNGEEGVHMTRGGNYSVIGYQSFSSKDARGENDDMSKIGARPMLYIND